MAEINNLAQSDLKKIGKASREMRYASPVNNTAIGRDGLLVYDGGVITIENGGLRVTGTAEIIGKLIASGTIEFNGPVKITGPLDISGLTQIMGNLILAAGGKFTAGSAVINPDGSATFGLFEIAANGNLKSKGSLSIEGVTTLKNHLTVDQGYKITLGGLVLENQGPGQAGVQMPGGGITASVALGLSINHDTVMVSAQTLLTLASPNVNVQGKLNVSGLTQLNSSLFVEATSTFRGALIHSAITNSTSAANLYVDANGRHWRSSSASRFKLDQQFMDLPVSLLDPVMKDWIDAGSQHRFDSLDQDPRPFREDDQMEYDSVSLRRVPGMVAEDVAAAGGEAFVTYDSEGLIDGFAYDRFALARTQILAEQLATERDRNDRLEARVKRLEELLTA